MYEPNPFEATPKKGMSTGAKVGIGCGVAALLLILICGGITWFTVRYFINEANKFAADFESRGYVRQSSQVIDVNQALNQPTVFLAQSVRINAPVEGSLAFAVQVAEINANVNGDIDFYGQILTINQGVVISGDVRIKGAQAFNNKGTVQGQVTGSYGNAKQQQPSQATPPASSSSDPVVPAAPDKPADDAASPPSPGDPG